MTINLREDTEGTTENTINRKRRNASMLAEIRLEDLKKSKSDKSLSNKSSSISLTSKCSEASIVAEERNNLEFEKLT